MSDDKPTFKVSDGRVIEVIPVSQPKVHRKRLQIIKQYRDRGEPIDPPRYKTVDAFGTEEEFEHNEASIKSAPPEERKLWEAHLDATERMRGEIDLEVSKILLLRGLNIEDPPDWWVEEQDYYGLPLPEDPRERKLEYILTEVFKTTTDRLLAVFKVTLVSSGGLDMEEQDAIEASFRRSIFPKSEKRKGDTPGETTAQEGPVEAQPVPVGGDGLQGMED